MGGGQTKLACELRLFCCLGKCILLPLDTIFSDLACVFSLSLSHSCFRRLSHWRRGPYPPLRLAMHTATRAVCVYMYRSIHFCRVLLHSAGLRVLTGICFLSCYIYYAGLPRPHRVHQQRPPFHFSSWFLLFALSLYLFCRAPRPHRVHQQRPRQGGQGGRAGRVVRAEVRSGWCGVLRRGPGTGIARVWWSIPTGTGAVELLNRVTSGYGQGPQDGFQRQVLLGNCFPC